MQGEDGRASVGTNGNTPAAPSVPAAAPQPPPPPSSSSSSAPSDGTAGGGGASAEITAAMSRILAEAVAAGLIPASSVPGLLHPSSSRNPPPPPGTPSPPPPPLLPDASIESFAAYVQANDCYKIVVMTGAGISTAAGIPDFRSPGTGLYDNLQRFGLPYPEAVFDIDYFRRKPQPFYELAKELYPGGFSPTYCHHFIKVLADEGLLLRCYTQNIDTLERVAGLTDEHLIEAHGSFHSATCVGRGFDGPDLSDDEDDEDDEDDGDSDDPTGGSEQATETAAADTGPETAEPTAPASAVHAAPHHHHHHHRQNDSDAADGAPAPPRRARRPQRPREPTPRIPGCGAQYPSSYVQAALQRGSGALPLCASCGTGLVKPDITFFGESLPARFHANAAADLARADALVVVGTSLTVYPFAGLIAQCRDDVPRLLINRERVGEAGRSGGFRVVGAGFDFDGTGGGVGAAPAFGRRPPPPPRRDALFLGDCDDGCRRLAELLGVAGKVDDAMRAFEEAHRHAAAAQTESPPRAAGVATLDHMMKDMTFGA